MDFLAFGRVSFRASPFRESSLSGFFFSEDFPVRDSKDSLQGLESGLTNFGLNSASQLEKNIFPVRKVIFQRFLNHDAKIRHSSYPVVRCRAMPCDCGTFSLKSPKILPVSSCRVNLCKFYHFRSFRVKFYQFRLVELICVNFTIFAFLEQNFTIFVL